MNGFTPFNYGLLFMFVLNSFVFISYRFILDHVFSFCSNPWICTLCVCFCSSLFLELLLVLYLNYAYLFINFLCLFWLGWHMFLLSGRSEFTFVVHVGGAAWLYYFRRIVHLDFVFRPRKFTILSFFITFILNQANIIYYCVSLVFAL